MRLGQLKDFEWLNDPKDVFFAEDGMEVESLEHTDFWQALHHGIQKDNGHLFFTRANQDFGFTVHWKFDDCGALNQCGAMVRIDNRNWLKVSIMSDDKTKLKLGTCATHKGYSDWAVTDIPKEIKEIWYRIKRVKGDYFVFYSTDGKSFKQARLMHFISDMSEVKVGAYICSPGKSSFRAFLSDVDFV